MNRQRRNNGILIPFYANILADAYLRRWKPHENTQKNFFRDTQNPFDVPQSECVKTYRLTQELAINLVEQISPHMDPGVRSTSIPSYLKVLVTLKFLGSGSYQHVTGLAAHIAMSQTSCSKAISLVCRTITNALLQNWVQFPATQERMSMVKTGFYNKFGFRGIIGCIDGTHVDIISPYSTDVDHPPYVYINRKGNHSINVMLICDSECHILACDARFPGSVHDSAIWRTSDVRAFLKTQFEAGDHSFRLLGDSGYGLEPWLFVPIGVVQEGTPEARFNDPLRSVRNTIERTNGVLKGRFRCLIKQRVLHYTPENAAYIIYAACVLHNMALVANLLLDEDEIIENEDQQAVPADIANDHLLELGRVARDNYIRENYNNN